MELNLLKPNGNKTINNKKILKQKDIFTEAGHALCWCEFDEQGCPLTEKDFEKYYCLTKKEILQIAKKIKKVFK